MQLFTDPRNNGKVNNEVLNALYNPLEYPK